MWLLSGSIIKNMAKGCSNGLMVDTTRVAIKMIIRTVREFLHGLTVGATRECGSLDILMEMVSSKIKTLS